MKNIKFLAIIVILLAWLGYYLNFGINGHLSDKTDVWGQFGDYIGGVVNPILSFITIYLLIQSTSLQGDANKSLLAEVKRQEALEKYKKYEIRFFKLIESQEVSFSRFRVVLDDDIDESNIIPNSPIEYKAGVAVNYIEDSLLTLIEANISKKKIINWLEDVDVDDGIFSVTRRFYLILKLIDENSCEEEKDAQYETLINLTEVKIICLIGIACVYFDWDAISYIKNSKILERDGIAEYIKFHEPNL